MAKPNYQFEKRQRELEKKKKKAEKEKRKAANAAGAGEEGATPHTGEAPPPAAEQ